VDHPPLVESSAERLYRLLLLDPRAAWTQKDLAARAGCSRGYVSRVIGSLTSAGVVARPYRNRVVLASPAKLLTLWAGRRSLPPPTYVATKRSLEQTEASLADRPGVALTLFRAAWHRTKFMRTASLEAYVLSTELSFAVRRLGAPSAEPTSVALYPAEGAELEGLERLDGLPLVSVPQNFVDLMATGGQGPRVAFHLARAHGLLGD